MWYWVTEPLLYLCFSIVSGFVLLNLVPEGYRPVIPVSHKIAAMAALGVGLFSFFPILRIVSFFAEDIGWWMTLQQVLFEFTEGRAFLFILACSLILSGMIFFGADRNDSFKLRGILFMLSLLMIAQGWSSHIAAWYGTWGILAQTLHIMAVSLWVGPLLLVGWQKQRTDHWQGFLSWYHPMAVLSMVVITASGFVLTIGVAPEYVNAWKLSYGQALLIKHLLMVPLVLFAILNGLWVKRRLSVDSSFNPQPWAKAESLILLIIFTVTGFMNQQPAPHDVSETLNESPASPLYLWFTGGNLNKESQLVITFDGITVMTFLAATFTIWTAIVCAKRHKVAQTFIWAMTSSLLLYYALMGAVI